MSDAPRRLRALSLVLAPIAIGAALVTTVPPENGARPKELQP